MRQDEIENDLNFFFIKKTESIDPIFDQKKQSFFKIHPPPILLISLTT